MKKNRIKLLFQITAALLLFACFLGGCGIGTSETTRLRDLEFTIISEERLPDELKSLIAERQIAVNDLYLTDNSIYISTSLLGPSPEDRVGTAPSYPFIVVKTEYLDKTVVFE